jgi:uncharacterized protein YbcI
LPAEQKLAEVGQDDRVRETRTEFQAATAGDFVAAVEKIVLRKVRSFASAVDADTNVIFENFIFEPSESDPETEQPRQDQGE